MGISPEGFKLIIIGVVALLGGVALSFWSRLAGLPLAALSLFFCCFSAFFFRDPERNKTFASSEIASPADGTILSVGSEDNPEVTVIRIFLSVFNVHIQRAPIDGNVTAVKFERGAFAIAYKPEASKNERNRISIDGGPGRFVEVEQITGSIARRIACYVKPGDAVKAPGKIGMIYFGSQVAVYLPKSARVIVKPGDKVAAGENVLALWQ